MLSWGGTYGACATAVAQRAGQGQERSPTATCATSTRCRKDLGDILKRFKKVLIPELNLGQLRMLIRAKYLVDAIGLNKVQGKPFSVAEVVEKIEACSRRHERHRKPRRTDRQETTAEAELTRHAHGG